MELQIDPSIVPGTFGALTDLLLLVGCIRAARKMHFLLLKNILKAPLSFFDVTPLGRILQRFSKDVDVLDSQLPMMMSEFLTSFLEVCMIIILLVVSYE